MNNNALPGQIVPPGLLIDVNRLIDEYYAPKTALGPVEFGTSGHRGSAFKGTFNEDHILAIAQAICEYRASQGITGPLFIGFDTHALSKPAFQTALEVLGANGVEIVVHKNDEFTPTPVVSRLIIVHNRKNKAQSDGIIITPSHNGPQDGGFKYNPPHGGPADTDITNWIQGRANQLIKDGLKNVKRQSYEKACGSAGKADFIAPYVEDLALVVDLKAISRAGIKIGADPLGGAGVHYWEVIAKKYGLKLTVTNPVVDPRFAFMPLDWDRTIRMDCSSPDAMASLVKLKDKYDIAFGNDTDFDRHGIVTPAGLMNPNHYLAAAIWYLLQNRPGWAKGLKVGKTLVSSSMIDKVVAGLDHELYEVPVGFKWFGPGLSEGWLAFGGEESAGASFLCFDGKVWVTEKDGFIMGLLAAEILAKTKADPQQIYDKLTAQYGASIYKRVDSDVTDQEKTKLKALAPESLTGSVAGYKIARVLTKAPGNGAPLGGIKVALEDGSWFALRPSGTEPKMKLYIESWSGPELLPRLQAEAPRLIFA